MFKKISKNKYGQTLLIITFFLFLILFFSLVLINYILSNNQTNLRLYYSSIASNLAEAGIDKAIWCLNQITNVDCGGTYGPNYIGESNVSLGDGKFSTTVTGTGTSRTIVSTGVGPKNIIKKIKVEVKSAPTSSDISFSYALQVGLGGATLENSSTVEGSIYSNGNVICTSNSSSLITGDVTVAGPSNRIEKCKINYDAAAHNLIDSRIGRNAYYTYIDDKTTVGGTKFPNSPDPSPTNLPTFDLTLWENLAANGGIIEGDYSPPDGSSLGPKKINGNLHINNNVHLNITGPIWVTKNITIDQGAVLSLDSSFGENGTLIIADNVTDLSTYGKIIINNGALIQSSEEKAYLLFISTNTSNEVADPAININNTAKGAIFLAPQGMIRLRNNAEVKSLGAYSIHLDQNAEVDYEESELINLNFSAGPGGNWQIKRGNWLDLTL